jgi:hypothetical protein
LENKNFAEPLLERAEEYARTSYELLKLKTVDKTTEVASAFASRGIALLVFGLFAVMLNIGLALWLGDLLGKVYYGFFCVAGFYGITACVLYFFMHNFIRRKLADSMIAQFFNK